MLLTSIWHGYDPGVKAELYSTCLMTPDGRYLIDPIRLQREAIDELIGSGPVAGIIVTNCNHPRASAKFDEKFSAPLFGRIEAFSNQPAREIKRVAYGEEICEGLSGIAIEGAGEGEIALRYAPDGGTLVIGDALINFFRARPRQFCQGRVTGCELRWTEIAERSVKRIKRRNCH